MKVSAVETVKDHLSYVLSNGVDYATRTIYLVGEIDDDLLSRTVVALAIFDTKAGPIRIVLSSSGGSESSGFALYDLIRLTRNPVTIDCYGEVQSIAALVLQAATVRRMSPECRYMMHYGHVNLGDQIDQRTMIAAGDEARKSNEQYQSLIAKRSGLTIGQIAAMCEKESHFSAEEAVDLGLADSIVVKEPPLKKGRRDKDDVALEIEIDHETIEKLTKKKRKTRKRK